MKKSTLILLALMLIVQLDCFTQITQDSVIVSLSEIKNANATFEKLKDCQILTQDLDSQIVRLEQVIEISNEKITDLYNIQDLNKDNLNICKMNVIDLESENKELKKEIRKQKFEKVLIIASAMVVQGMSIYLIKGGL